MKPSKVQSNASIIKEQGEALRRNHILIEQLRLTNKPDSKLDPVKQWHGPEDGLPPVGTKCSILGSDSGAWSDGVIDYIDKSHCIWHWAGEKQTIHNRIVHMQFRPALTEEDKAVDAMMEASGKTGDLARCICTNLYRAIKSGEIEIK